MAMAADIWTFTSEFMWVKDYMESLRVKAITEMAQGVSMERYAELRGVIFACEYFLQAPEMYSKELAKREARNAEEISRIA
jgi:hypothetical protein